MLNNLFNKDESSDEQPTTDSDSGTLFESEGDEMDDFGNFGDESDDDLFGGIGGEPNNDIADVEDRVDDIENELAGMSSTMNTIKRENEEISGSVEDIEDNIRKLLDIYEMVTRGVNPFVDDEEIGGQTTPAGSFGVFEARSNTEEQPDEELDESIANADASAFFEDNIDEPSDEGTPPTESEVSPPSAEKELSFDQLKAEYESGEADWVDENPADPVQKKLSKPVEPRPKIKDSAVLTEPNNRPPGDESVESPPDGDFHFIEDTVAGSAEQTAKPYLKSVPGGYVGDLIVMEWLRYLVQKSDRKTAEQALDYYVAIQWIAEPVATEIEQFLDAFGRESTQTTDDTPDMEDEVGLTLEDHTRSLRYICYLSNETPGSVVLNSGMIDEPLP